MHSYLRKLGISPIQTKIKDKVQRVKFYLSPDYMMEDFVDDIKDLPGKIKDRVTSFPENTKFNIRRISRDINTSTRYRDTISFDIPLAEYLYENISRFKETALCKFNCDTRDRMVVLDLLEKKQGLEDEMVSMKNFYYVQSVYTHKQVKLTVRRGINLLLRDLKDYLLYANNSDTGYSKSMYKYPDGNMDDRLTFVQLHIEEVAAGEKLQTAIKNLSALIPYLWW